MILQVFWFHTYLRFMSQKIILIFAVLANAALAKDSLQDFFVSDLVNVFFCRII